MLTHGQEEVARDALLGAVRRARNFSDIAESDLISWPVTYSAPCSLGVLAPGPFLDFHRNRIASHIYIGLQLSVPIQQKIDAETETQLLGLAGVILTASAVLSLTERIRTDFIPSPDYFPPGRFIALLGKDSLPISILFHRFAAGRVDGRTLPRGRFLWKCAPILGAHVAEPDSPPGGGEAILAVQGRSRIQSSAALVDFRRSRRPSGSLAHFLAAIPVSVHCFGFYRE